MAEGSFAPFTLITAQENVGKPQDLGKVTISFAN